MQAPFRSDSHTRNSSFSAHTVKMLRPRPDADEARGNLSQDWKPFQQTKADRQRAFVLRGLTSNQIPMDENLHRLDEPRRPFAACLHFAQIVHRNRTGSQFFAEK